MINLYIYCNSIIAGINLWNKNPFDLHTDTSHVSCCMPQNTVFYFLTSMYSFFMYIIDYMFKRKEKYLN